ncbi:MAG: restriction endonuclease subunit S [Actinobacteria bacterium]|nr:restriction endonuclease subunit S [Actinomycetota bacterium]
MGGSRTDTKTRGRPATTGVIPGDFSLNVGRPDRQAPEGWVWTPLCKVARLETGHTPSRRHPEYWGGDTPWVGIKDATENHGRVIHDTFQHTNELGIAHSSARILPKDTVCLSRTASVGYVVVMGRPMATSQDFVNWVCSKAVDHRFLKYVLLAERSAFLRFASGTTHQTIYFPEVKAFHVCLPPISEQRAIAHILGSLDDKIELNRRMNQTLEGIARALFKSWFVDFDPVKAKAEGRDTGLPGHVADLFPDSFEETELGEIPKGWNIQRLGDLLDLEYGKALKAENRCEGRVPVYGSNGQVGWHDERLVRGPGVVVGRKGNPGIVTWAPTDFFVIDTAFFVRPKPLCPSHHFLFHVLQTHDLHSLAADSAVPGLNRNLAYMNLQVQPPAPLVTIFESVAGPLAERCHNAAEESRTLAGLRDALLPKLVSGQLRVGHTDKANGRMA